MGGPCLQVRTKQNSTEHASMVSTVSVEVRVSQSHKQSVLWDETEINVL